MTLDELDLPLSQMEKQVFVWVEEALAIRAQSGSCVVPSDPVSGLDALVQVRASLDRLEEILSRATRARGRVLRATTHAKALADDRWDEIAKNTRHQEFTATREKYADINLETLEERRTARAAEHLLSAVNEAYEIIRLAHRGLEGVRQDYLAMLRTLSFESHLERSTNDRGY